MYTFEKELAYIELLSLTAKLLYLTRCS